MLILTRRIGESVMIGEAISVTVLGGMRGQIKLGINAPGDVKILRSELMAQDVAGPGDNPSGEGSPDGE